MSTNDEDKILPSLFAYKKEEIPGQKHGLAQIFYYVSMHKAMRKESFSRRFDSKN